MSAPSAARGRWAALAALALLCCLAVPLLALAADLADVLIVLGCLFAATYWTWILVTRRGAIRVVAVPVVLLALAGLISFCWNHRLELIAWLAILVLFGFAARTAVRSGRSAPGAPPPARPVPPARHGVLVVNPLAGGGAAARAGLLAEAGRRGIATVVLTPGADLREVVLRVIRDGADVVGMAGGDGSQAVVAALAAEHDVAHVCVPAGTRNHFALDLGLDRGDVAGALDAFTDGVERRVDLAEVNGRVFVNTASLGLYATVVRTEGYRGDQAGTWARALPDVAGPGAPRTDLRFPGPDGPEISAATLLLVSNNAYAARGPAVVSGTRPRLDAGTLGVVSADLRGPDAVARFVMLSALAQEGRMRAVRRWSVPELVVRSSAPSVPVGLDGEAVELAAPLHFVSRPGALRVRLPAHAAGLSPSASAVRLNRHDLDRLIRIAAGRPGES